MPQDKNGTNGQSLPASGKFYPAPPAAAPARRFADIAIRGMRHLRGPGFWTYRPAVEAVVDIGELEDFPSNTLPGFYERLTHWLPGLIEHRCSVGERGGFLSRLSEGTWPAHIMEHVALELQTRAGVPTGFGKARMTHERGVYKVVIRTPDAAVGRLALQSARDLVMAAINDTPFDAAAAIAELAALADCRCLGPSTASIVQAGAERGIPAIRLNGGNLVQLGHGAAQRRIWTAETDRTSAIAEGISRDKDMTRQLLAAAGVPVPQGRVVESPGHAWEAAQDIGLPVAVKPLDGNHARGVSLNLNTQQQVQAAFAAAEAEGSGVMVERFIAGHEHRLLVVGEKVVAATRGEIVEICGDGLQTVAQLIDSQINTDPRRGEAEHLPLETMRPDDPVLLLLLQGQGLTPASVPAAGQKAVVQRTGNMSVDVTAQVHPDTACLAALAARVVGLDIAGIDLVAQDIAQPLHAQGGAVVEVNAGPSLLMHLKPAQGQPQPVGAAIVSHLFAPEETGRIPLALVLGEDGCKPSLAAHLLAAMLRISGRRTALASANGLWLDTRQIGHADARQFDAGERALINPTVQAAVLECTPRQILAEGLPCDRCAVGIVMHMPAPDGLQDLYVTEAQQIPAIARTPVDLVLPGGAAVLNADAAAVAALAEHCDGATILFARDGNNPAVAAHRAQNGRALFMRGSRIVLAEGAEETPLLDMAAADLPALAASWGAASQATPQANAAVLQRHMLAAAAAACALGLPATLVRAGLTHFGETQASATAPASPAR